MGFHTKALGGLIAAAIIGGGTAYLATDGEITECVEAMVSEVICYVVKSEESSVVLYKEGEDEPLMSFAADLSRLPRADKELLKNGIRLRGMNEVMRLLEDLDIESVGTE